MHSISFLQAGVVRRDKLLYQFTIAPGQIKISHCRLEFVISLDCLGEGLVGYLVLSAGALETVLACWGRTAGMSRLSSFTPPWTTCQQWLVARLGRPGQHNPLVYLLDFAPVSSGREGRLPGD